MGNGAIENGSDDEYINEIHYGISKQLLEEIRSKGLISQEEFYAIDELNRKSFHQEISSDE